MKTLRLWSVFLDVHRCLRDLAAFRRNSNYQVQENRMNWETKDSSWSVRDYTAAFDDLTKMQAGKIDSGFIMICLHLNMSPPKFNSSPRKRNQGRTVKFWWCTSPVMFDFSKINWMHPNKNWDLSSWHFMLAQSLKFFTQSGKEMMASRWNQRNTLKM